MCSSSFLSSLVRSSPKNSRNSARFSSGVRGSKRRDLAHRLEVLDEIVALLLRQVMRECPGLGIIGRRQSDVLSKSDSV